MNVRRMLLGWLSRVALTAEDADDATRFVVFHGGQVRTMTAAEVLSDLHLQASGITLPYVLDLTSQAANPGAGKMRFNHATIASATGIEISETAQGAAAAADALALAVRGSTIIVRKTRGDNTQLAVFTAGATTDNGSHRSIAVTHVYSNGAFVDEGDVLVTILPSVFTKETITGYNASGTFKLGLVNNVLTWRADT